MRLFIDLCTAAVEPLIYIVFLFVAFVAAPALITTIKNTMLSKPRRERKQRLADWRPKYYAMLLAAQRRLKHENRTY